MKSNVLSRSSPDIEYPYVMTSERVLLLSFLVVVQFFVIIFFLGASETAEYSATFKYLRLSGYALCIMIPFYLFYMLEKEMYQRITHSWNLKFELISKTLLIFTILSACYFYNVWVINGISPDVYSYFYFLFWYGLPYVPVLLPICLIYYKWYLNKEMTIREQTTEIDPVLTIQGKNRGETVQFRSEDFLIAEAEQNYVSLYYLEEGSIERSVIRSALKDVSAQIPGAHRVHRSYLANPEVIDKVVGNTRKREAYIAHLDRHIPVSSSYVPE